MAASEELLPSPAPDGHSRNCNLMWQFTSMEMNHRSPLCSAIPALCWLQGKRQVPFDSPAWFTILTVLTCCFHHVLTSHQAQVHIVCSTRHALHTISKSTHCYRIHCNLWFIQQTCLKHWDKKHQWALELHQCSVWLQLKIRGLWFFKVYFGICNANTHAQTHKHTTQTHHTGSSLPVILFSHMGGQPTPRSRQVEHGDILFPCKNVMLFSGSLSASQLI